MNKESKSKFNLWLSEHPESFHPSDEARMFDFVNSSMKRREIYVLMKFSVDLPKAILLTARRRR